MILKKHKRTGVDVPLKLRQIPDAPEVLYILGNHLDELLTKPTVSIVGSRKLTPYGKGVTEDLAAGLARNGVVVISGLALGVDGAAHQAALRAGGKSIAVLPCGLDRIYPRTHHHLGKEILAKGGALVSEYPENTEPFQSNFIARNRIVSGLADILLITEAAEKSGTLHTVNFALAQGKTVMAVPGNITSEQSRGANNIIKAGALPVTGVEDILRELNITTETSQTELFANSETELTILKLIQQGSSDGAELLTISGLSAAEFGQTLTMLELAGRIRPLGNNHWALN